MAKRRLTLFSGMGGDARLFAPLRVPEAQLITPEPLEPLAGEDLRGYALRIADSMKIGPSDVIGGASFGGMVAAEIASGRPVAGLVMLGCFLPDAVLAFEPWPQTARRRASAPSAV